MAFTHHSRCTNLARRLLALFVGLWLSAAVLPCAMADASCAACDLNNKKICELASMTHCESATLNCELPSPNPLSAFNLDVPVPAVAILTIVAPTVPVRDLILRRQWQETSLQRSPPLLHLQSVRLLI